MISIEKALIENIKQHWDAVYENSKVERLGWFEQVPEPSLQLINQCNLNEDASILNVGAGATTLIDELIKLGFRNIIANDISSVALNKLKVRIGNTTQSVSYVVDDLSKPEKLLKLYAIDLWHDRAVLHFLIKEEDQQTYFDLLKTLVKSKGFVIIATFNLNGAIKCSGLPVKQYDESLLQDRLGSEFELKNSFDYTYHMPSGDTRQYVYTLFKRR